MDVFERQLREVGEDLVGRHPLSNHADHRGDRYARAADARYAAHDPMIDGDPLEGHDQRLRPPLQPGTTLANYPGLEQAGPGRSIAPPPIGSHVSSPHSRRPPHGHATNRPIRAHSSRMSSSRSRSDLLNGVSTWTRQSHSASRRICRSRALSSPSDTTSTRRPKRCKGILQLGEVEQRAAGLEVDKEVDVAVPCLLAGGRPSRTAQPPDPCGARRLP
jgi:hypothetical protein